MDGYQGIVGVLREIAVKGYANIPDWRLWGAPIVELISEMNVGGVVTRSSNVVGVPKSIRCAPYGIVPSTQYMRIAIACQLYEYKKTRGLASA